MLGRPRDRRGRLRRCGHERLNGRSARRAERRRPRKFRPPARTPSGTATTEPGASGASAPRIAERLRRRRSMRSTTSRREGAEGAGGAVSPGPSTICAMSSIRLFDLLIAEVTFGRRRVLDLGCLLSPFDQLVGEFRRSGQKRLVGAPARSSLRSDFGMNGQNESARLLVGAAPAQPSIPPVQGRRPQAPAPRRRAHLTQNIGGAPKAAEKAPRRAQRRREAPDRHSTASRRMVSRAWAKLGPVEFDPARATRSTSCRQRTAISRRSAAGWLRTVIRRSSKRTRESGSSRDLQSIGPIRGIGAR